MAIANSERSTSSIARRETFLPFSPPDISEEEIAAVVDTLCSSWITTGPKTRKFEGLIRRGC